MHNFHKRLFSLRKKKNISQMELAEALNISRQTLSKWENGTIMPDATNLVSIAKYFEVSVDYLLGICDNSAHPKLSLKHWIYLILLIISLLGFFILLILSSYNPCIVWIDDIMYTGFSGYIHTYNLQWLVLLLGICVTFSMWELVIKEKFTKSMKYFF